MRMYPFAAGFVLLALSYASIASDATYEVSMTITREGETIVSPTLVVREGIPASARVDGDEQIEIRVLVSAGNPAKLEATVAAGERQGPTIVAEVGKRASLSAESLSVELLAEPVAQ